MPNWSNNLIAIKGETNKVLDLLNYGLLNSDLAKADSIATAVEMLENDGKHKVRNEGKVEKENGLTLRTFLPMPDTFLLYDTTNCADKFPEAAQEQDEKYGVIGWYDYNLKTLGCKWDAELSVTDVHEADGIATIFLYCDTPWSYPHEWMCAMEEHGVKVFILTKEEGADYYFYGRVGQEQINLLPKTEELFAELVDDEEDEGYDDYYEALEELWDENVGEFTEYVLKY